MTALSESFYLTPFLGRSRPHCSLVGSENPFLTVSSALWTTAPDATDPGCICSNPSHTTNGTTNSTTSALQLSPWRLGPGAQLLSGPCTTVSNQLSTGPMATLPAVLYRAPQSW